MFVYWILYPRSYRLFGIVHLDGPKASCLNSGCYRLLGLEIAASTLGTSYQDEA